jgi:hypothetical protein
VGGKGSNPIGESVPMDGLHTKNGLPTNPVDELLRAAGQRVRVRVWPVLEVGGRG